MKSLHQPRSNSERMRLILLRAISIFIFLTSIAFVIAFAYADHKRGEVQELVADMQQIKSGINSGDELTKLSHKYRGTFYADSGKEEPTRNNGSYQIRISGPFIVIRNHFLHFPGQRPWTVLATFDVNDDSLDGDSLTVAAMRSDGVILQGSIITRFKTPPENLKPSYIVREPHVTGPPTEAVEVGLRPGATPEQTQRAFEFNIRCLTGIRECRHVCELMRGAWGDLPLEKRLRYADGHENIIDAECRTALKLSK